MKEKRIAKLGLDTFAVEPLPANSPLRELGDAILTPHIVGHTLEAIEAAERTLIQNILNVLAGEPPLYVRNVEVLPEWSKRWRGHQDFDWVGCAIP